MTTPHPVKRSKGARIAAFAGATVVGLLALGLLAVGGASLWANGQKDDHGYLSTGSDRFATSSHAIATEDLDIDGEAPGWLVDADRYGKVRLKVDSRSDKPVFVGIAPTREVTSYLRETAHATVTDVSYSPFRATYGAHTGSSAPTPPAERGFWAASAHGSGPQTLTWDVKHGSWSVVVMNADGSRGVDAGVSAGANVPVLSTIGWGALGGGLLLLIVAGGLVVLGVRKPRGGAVALAATPAPAA
jgi:hypothetical protein